MPEPTKPTPQDTRPRTVQSIKMEVDTALLSSSLVRELTRLPKQDWTQIAAVYCHVDFTWDMAAGIRFVDRVANVLNDRGGLFSTFDPKKRRDLEQASQQIVEAFRTFIIATVEVARKAGLTEMLQRHWRLLSVYGPPPADNAATPITSNDGVKLSQIA